MAAPGDPSPATGRAGRPLRADAARNHRAIVAAAADAFAALGADAPLEEVARRAGVAPSTLYRRFAGRDELVAAVFAAYFEGEIEPLLARAALARDPGEGLADVLRGVAGAVVAHRELLAAAKDSGAFTADVVARFMRPLDTLLARARAAGRVRPDLLAADLPVLVMMIVSTAAPFGGEADPQRQDRYLALVLDALEPSSGSAAGRVLPPLDLPEESA